MLKGGYFCCGGWVKLHTPPKLRISGDAVAAHSGGSKDNNNNNDDGNNNNNNANSSSSNNNNSKPACKYLLPLFVYNFTMTAVYIWSELLPYQSSAFRGILAPNSKPRTTKEKI